jgi:hypothetical protein
MSKTKKKLKPKYRRIQGIECPLCKQKIWSRHRHDMRYCQCGYCFVDGGRDYLRFGYGGEDYPKPTKLPKMIKIRITQEEYEASVSDEKPFPY